MKILYQCEICGKKYNTEIEAIKCERTPYNPKLKVGDIIKISQNFGWFDGDKKWIRNPNVGPKNGPMKRLPCPNGNSNCFEECCCYSFYWVVTAIDRDPQGLHRPRYHIFTEAMTGNMGYHSCYVFDTHLNPEKIEFPPSYIVETSKKYFGMRSEYLL